MHDRGDFLDDDDDLGEDFVGRPQLGRSLPVPATVDASLVACLEGVTPRYGRFKMRQLALVLKLVGTGNLHDAAAALNMSQPAATKLLQEIEEALGADLFIRQARGMKPTP